MVASSAITDGRWTVEGGEAHAVRVPDGRWHVRLPPEREDIWATLLGQIHEDVGAIRPADPRPHEGELVVTADGDATAAQVAALDAAGLAPARRIQHWTVPVGSLAATGTVTADGHRLVPIDDADLERVVALDDALRDEIPGTAGWRGTVRFLQDEIDGEDPSLYLIAEHTATGDYDGLIRVWNRARLPRLGCLGVRAGLRGSRVTAALLTAVGRVLADRGTTAVTTETDVGNHAVVRLARRLAAEPGRVEVEWTR